MDNLLLEIKKEVADVSIGIKKSNPDLPTKDVIHFVTLSYFASDKDLFEDNLEKGVRHQIGDIVKWGNRFWRKLSDNKWVKLPKKVAGKKEKKKKESTGKKKVKPTKDKGKDLKQPRTKFKVAQEKA